MDPWTALNFFDGWSVYGIRNKGRCYVVASTKVSTITMRQGVSQASFRAGTFHEKGWGNTEITQRLSGDMAVGEGDSFQEALADLFGNWNPDVQPEELEATPAISTPYIELGVGDV